MYNYTTKDEREDERFQALRDEYAKEITQLFNDGWRGQVGLRLPQVKRVSKCIDGRFVYSHDKIVYDLPFPNAVFDALSNDSCMALLLDAADPNSSAPTLFMQQLREACAQQFLVENLDDIVRCAWESRDAE